jgi:transposase
LTRRVFTRCLDNRPPLTVVMEACGIKLARRLWAVDRHGAAFNPNHTSCRPA